jgi:DNA-binding LacI/PurR family transcriptional regulator
MPPRVKGSEEKDSPAPGKGPGARLVPTVEEVARLASVSTATVSRVVNGSPNVRPDTRESVERAIDELGYVPNRAARALVTRRTDTIALVVSESETRVFSDPFFPSIVRGISAALADTDLQLLLLMARGAPEHAKVERYLQQGHVDGVILMSLHGHDSLPRVLPEAGVPTVLVGRPRLGERLPYVDADNRGGAHAATTYLFDIGRRQVATITGPLDMTVGIDRYDGYTDAVRDSGRRVRKSLVVNGDFSRESGARAMKALLHRQADLDAVFVANDRGARGPALGRAPSSRRRRRDRLRRRRRRGDDRPAAHDGPAATRVDDERDGGAAAQTDERPRRRGRVGCLPDPARAAGLNDSALLLTGKSNV